MVFFFRAREQRQQINVSTEWYGRNNLKKNTSLPIE